MLATTCILLSWNTDSFNLVVNNGAAAGQVIFHVSTIFKLRVGSIATGKLHQEVCSFFV
jgi:hypothetical protein